jgi:hypothetical protein
VSRLSVVPWLAIWALLSAGQVAAVASWIDVSQLLTVVAVIALQFAKLPFAAARLRDLGRPPDDASLTFLPLANIGLWGQLLARTPKEEVRQRLIARWSAEATAVAAVREGLRLFVKAFPAVLLFALPAGVIYAGFGELARWFLDWAQNSPGPEADQLKQTLFIVAGLIGLYTLLQVGKRERATRASWIPSLFLAPALLLAGALALRGGRDAGPGLIAIVYMGLDLVWGSLFGSLFAIAWLTIGDRAQRGRTDIAELVSDSLAAMRERGADMIAVHGGTYHAVNIGLQVIIPGIHYWLLYAFADMAVLFSPEKPAFQTSTRLTDGIRRRVFKAQWIVLLAYMLPMMVIGMSRSGVAEFFNAALFDPTMNSATDRFITGGVWMMTVALMKLVMLVMYREREARLAAVVTPSVPASPAPTVEPA